MTQIIYGKYFFCNNQIYFSLKNTFKIIMYYFFRIFITYSTVIYDKLDFELKIDPIRCNYKI